MNNIFRASFLDFIVLCASGMQCWHPVYCLARLTRMVQTDDHSAEQLQQVVAMMEVPAHIGGADLLAPLARDYNSK